MATQFDATARIQLDIRSFAQGAAAVTKSGGVMEKTFASLSNVLGKVALVEGDLAKKLSASLAVYNQITAATKNYASAVATLQKNEQAGANGAKLMTQAFSQLRAALAQVQGLSEKEYQRLSRTVALYNQMAGAIQKLAAAQKSMSSITQAAIVAQQKEAEAKRKAEESARKLAIAEERLALAKQKTAQAAADSAQKIALAEQRMALQRERAQQAATRIQQSEDRLVQTRNRSAQATRDAAASSLSYSASTFALRNSIGQLEQGFQSLFNIITKVPTALAGAAISQEKAFAQVARVVGETEAASVGLLQTFQSIAQNAPISFEEVARIGQLGAAIGISEQNLGDFTDTIVKFSLTTGVASEEATVMLGRIAQMQNVPISQIDQLGSAILALGTASAATDQEILRVNSSIATVSNLFGLTAQETSGLAAALATLQVRPELSRGALTRVFNDLTTSVSAGGVELSKLSQVMGVTNEEALKLFNNPGTRGDFLLTFIDGLSKFAGVGGDVQGVLRELGIHAVRDIDVFSRLANNVDLVRESFDRANVEFARGSELNRQSKGIYETTAAELQNLSDAFKTLLATLGGPLASAIGSLASGVSEVIEGLAHLGPIVPIVGTLTAVVAAGGAAWLIYQIALAKTISSLIATKELQNNLKITTLSARTAYAVYRGELGAVGAAQAATANSTRHLAASNGLLATSLSQSQAGQRAFAAASASSAAGMGLMSARTVAASRDMRTMYAAAASSRGMLMQLNSAGAANALAMTHVSSANRALVTTQSQLAASTRATNTQMAASATSMANVNRVVPTTGYVMATMTNNMRNAAVAGATLGAGLRNTVNAGTTAATAFTRVGEAATRAGLAARAASFMFSPWGAILLTVGILATPFISKMISMGSAAEEMAKSAMEATGGTQALANAIRTDTEVFGQTERAYRTITLSSKDLNAAQRSSAETAIGSARAQLRAIEMTKGSVSELRQQAKGHGTGAEAARRYLREIDAANNSISENTQVLSKNTVAIGENVKQWLTDTAAAALEQSKLVDGSERSSDALDQLAKSGVDVGNVLEQSLTNPQKALDVLNKAIAEADVTSKQIGGGGDFLPSEGLLERAAAAERLKTFLEALKITIEAQGGELTKNAVLQGLLKDAMDDTGASASSLSGNIKLGRESLEDLDTTAEAAQVTIDELAKTFEAFGTPMDAFKTAAEAAFGDAEDAIEKFSLNSKSGLESYIKELEKIATAQRDWSANLIEISAKLGPDVAEMFRKLGPEAAPALEEIVNLGAKELEKLGPRLSAIGSSATSDLAASIVAGSGKIENASAQTRGVIADTFGKLIDKAKTAEDFASISSEYGKLLGELKGLAGTGVTIDIKAADAAAFKSLSDLRTYIDLVGQKKIEPKFALDLVKAQGDIGQIQAIIQRAVMSGALTMEAKIQLDTFLFETQLAQLGSSVAELSAGGKFDPKGKGKLSDEEYRAKVQSLTEFLGSTEGAGLLNPQGEAQLHDENYIARMRGLATLILGEEKAKKFDIDGDGKLNPVEFQIMLNVLKDAVRRANKGQLDPKGKVILTNAGAFQGQLNGVVRAAQTAGSRISQALSRNVTVNVGYNYYRKNNPPSTMAAANGGWIHGPGGPKSDVIPTMLSNGEFVVNAASAKRFGGLLEVLNRAGGRGFSGVAKRLMDAGVTGGSKPVRVTQGGSGTTMLGSNNVMQRVPPESVSVFAARMAMPSQGPTNIFNIHNQYPQAESTSVTINRSLVYAATISGV